MNKYYQQMLKASQELTGSRRWECIGKSVYRKLDTFVWKEKDGWYRTTLPTSTFRMALASVGMSPLGMFTNSSGPYKTMKSAKEKRRP